MCLSKKQGIRCVSHARIDLETANKTGTDAEKKIAQDAYDMTCTGTKELLEQALVEEANGNTKEAEALKNKAARNNKKRLSKLNEYKKERCVIAADPNTAFPILTKMLETRSEPSAARLLAAKSIIVRDHIAFGDKTLEQLAGMFSIPLNPRGVKK